jgi:glycosyltransferase involved in cell wall biosynthesis
VDYIIVVQTPAFSLGSSFAVESAFALHLVALRRQLSGRARRVVLIAPQMSAKDYAAQRHHLSVLNCLSDEIFFMPGYNLPLSGTRFWLRALPLLLLKTWRMMPNTAVVHSGMSFDLRRPMLVWINVVAWLRGRPILFVLDIDFRNDANRFRQLGVWSSSKYLLTRVALDPYRLAQVWAASRVCGLVLLKGETLVEDVGRGRPNIKNFYDSVHSEEHVLEGVNLARKLAYLRSPSGPFIICFFGRLVWKKGLDRILDSLSLLRASDLDVRLIIIGDGDMLDSIITKIDSLSLGPHVQIHRQVQYGKTLFDLIDTAHLCVAAPLIEDTPRAAFDSLARALPILAFDITYFKDLAEASHAVAVVDWPKPEALAAGIEQLLEDRSRLARMAENGVRFAMTNTQEIWMQRRADWTNRLLFDEVSSPSE